MIQVYETTMKDGDQHGRSRVEVAETHDMVALAHRQMIQGVSQSPYVTSRASSVYTGQLKAAPRSVTDMVTTREEKHTLESRWLVQRICLVHQQASTMWKQT